jgi:predicted DNA-binding transcriptional regulator YafY
MRADRLLSILFLLQGNGRMTARSLAARLEVSERTIDRDMEALSMSGVPVWAERGRGGGWQLSDAYRTDLTGLTESELRSLALTTAPAVLGDLGLSEAADRAVLKLLAGLPAARRRKVETARRYLHIDPRGWRRTDDAAPLLPALDEALRTDRRVAMTYERADGSVVERRTNPLGLVAKGSVWYLVAGSGEEPRTYRASRIRAVQLLDEPIERPADFDLPEFWGRSRDEFVARLPRYVATIRVSPVGLEKLGFGWWRFTSLIETREPDPDGWSTCRIQADTIEVAHGVVLGLGIDVRVVEPAELRERVAASIRAMAATLTA